MSICIPIVVGQLVSVIASQAQFDISKLNRSALKLLALFAAQGALTFLDISLVSQLGENLANSLRMTLYRSLLLQEMSFFDTHMQGELLGRLSVDVQEFKHAFKLVITQGLRSATQAIGAAYSLIAISGALTCSLLSSMPLIYVLMTIYGQYLRDLSRQARIADSEADGICGQALGNMKVVRAFVAESREADRYSNSIKATSHLQTQLGFHIGLFQGLNSFGIGSMTLIILYHGSYLISEGRISSGDLMAYLVATQNIQRSLAHIGILFGKVSKASGAANRIFEHAYTGPNHQIREGGLYPAIKGDIEFSNVSFKVVLSNLVSNSPQASDS